MTRVGVSPTRSIVSEYKPARVTVAVLTYIPELDGYYTHRLDVLKLTLASIIANTTLPYDLMVFDNGSCKAVVDYLRDMKIAGKVDYLLLSSRNVGKIGALRVLFDAAPGELIAYSDDDIFFYPGWLKAQLEIFETFPNVGMVSGMPVRDRVERASKTLHKFMEEKPSGLEISYQRRISDEWERDWAASVGRDPEEHLKNTKDSLDLILKYGGVEAFGSANHFQFMSPKAVITQAVPAEWSGRLMGQMIELDEAVDALGCLRLTTADRYTRHMGNMVSVELAEEVKTFGLGFTGQEIKLRDKRHPILRIPGAGRILRKIYDWLFKVLNRVE
jgi:glycosyltransferase involved in cell wall biosynthesis